MIRYVTMKYGGRPVLLIALTLALACTAGCTLVGYKAGAVYDSTIQSVAVPIFSNRTFYRGVGFDVTEAVIKEIEARTPYRVLDPPAADTLLTGTILSVDQRVLSRTDAALGQELQVILTVGFEWRNRRTGELIRKRTVTGTGEYVATRPLSEPYPVGQQAAVEEISREIVSLMRDSWGAPSRSASLEKSPPPS